MPPLYILSSNMVLYLVDEFEEILISGKNFDKIGDLLHLNWVYKKKVNSETSSSKIDYLYKQSLKLGAKGGKILGAGGGGFLMLYVNKKIKNLLNNKLNNKNLLNVKIDTVGSRLTYYDQDL